MHYYTKHLKTGNQLEYTIDFQTNHQYPLKQMSTSTDDQKYTERLVRLQHVWWKKFFDVQAPYRWNLRRLSPGFTLEIGCGIGRNLSHLDGNGVGVDHNPFSVKTACALDLTAFIPSEFKTSEFAKPASFDSLLLSHVAEHMTLDELVSLINEYSSFVRNDGCLILICPQERGYKSDSSHKEFMDFDKLGLALEKTGFKLQKKFSFPFPRWMGTLFIYNEFVVVGRK